MPLLYYFRDTFADILLRRHFDDIFITPLPLSFLSPPDVIHAEYFAAAIFTRRFFLRHARTLVARRDARCRRRHDRRLPFAARHATRHFTTPRCCASPSIAVFSSPPPSRFFAFCATPPCRQPAPLIFILSLFSSALIADEFAFTFLRYLLPHSYAFARLRFHHCLISSRHFIIFRDIFHYLPLLRLICFRQMATLFHYYAIDFDVSHFQFLRYFTIAFSPPLPASFAFAISRHCPSICSFHVFHAPFCRFTAFGH
jgi:hypothetical protein